MASRFQQQSLRRKIVYFVLIVGLFTATLVFRNVDRYGVEAQARQLELREQDVGDVGLTDRALRLSLTGSRGLAVCGLWWASLEKQKKHEWNELELLVRSVIKLQPHFVTPWMFQSWNLAYNVSVECDRVKDKYFYVTRGIQLLGEGERQNRDNPDMRLYIGLYTQNKMGISDENNTMRSLFQLSCIDPIERDPARMRRYVDGRAVIDLDRFEEFCRRHPTLVRRLHDALRYDTPDKIIGFLAANQKIPSIWRDRPEGGADSEGDVSQLKEKLDLDRFPLLPPPSVFGSPRGELTYDSPLADDFDSYADARAWFSYAQDPLQQLGRKPHQMAQIIFEQYAARAQAYIGERVEQEGWFDATGWAIKNWFPKDGSRPSGEKRTIVVGNEREWGMDAWEKAFQMYRDFGEYRGLYKTPEQLRSMGPGERQRYGNDRQLTNFPHHYARSNVERNRETVTARRCFFEADQLRRAGNREQALEKYELPEAFPAWKKILLEHPEFQEDVDVQEETYIMERKWVQMVIERRLPSLRPLLVARDVLTAAAIAPAGVPEWVPIHLNPATPIRVKLPFDVKTAAGHPLVSERAVSNALSRYSFMSRDPYAPRRVQAPPKPASKDLPRVQAPRPVLVKPGD